MAPTVPVMHPPAYRFTVERNVMMRTRDGVQLAADVYTPTARLDGQPLPQVPPVAERRRRGDDDDDEDVDDSDSKKSRSKKKKRTTMTDDDDDDGDKKAAGSGGRFPCMVVRTPYDKSWRQWKFTAVGEGEWFAARGWLVVVQDVRGRFGSQGEWYPFRHEAADGYDCVEWAARLPACNGDVVTCGQSYMGHCQLALASQRPPSLRAMCVVSGFDRIFHNGVRRNGCFELLFATAYYNMLARNQMARQSGRQLLSNGDAAELDAWHGSAGVKLGVASMVFRALGWRHLHDMFNLVFPPSAVVTQDSVPRALLGKRIEELSGSSALRDALEHDTYDDYWKAFESHAAAAAAGGGSDDDDDEDSGGGKEEEDEEEDSESDTDDGDADAGAGSAAVAARPAGASPVPVLHVGSFYDYFSESTVRLFARDSQGSSPAAKQTRMLLGPWGHILRFARPNDGGAGDFKFGPGAAIQLHDQQLRFFANVLGHDDQDYPAVGSKTFPVVAYPLSSDPRETASAQWCGLKSWPPPVATTYDVRLLPTNALKMPPARDEDDDDVPRKKALRRLEDLAEEAEEAEKAEEEEEEEEDDDDDEKTVTFRSDPNDPVPTLGGCVIAAEWDMGVRDQRPLAPRYGDDIATFTMPTDPLGDGVPFAIVGNVSVTLTLSSTAPDTDVTAKLVEIDASSGYERILVDNINRIRSPSVLKALEAKATPAASQSKSRKKSSSKKKSKSKREEDQDEWDLDQLAPVSHQTVTFDLGPIFQIVMPQNQLRLDIASSNFPRFDVNPHTGRSAAIEPRERWQTATQTLHTKDCRLHLPIAPANLFAYGTGAWDGLNRTRA